ncbi:baeRF3 domain-containing protein [Oligoflexus tunisiensis]|uniref:baeRF3 domain-containing protein n=1 Tax=Oligoflexus tunisiensis TaxID=708132 RepID=UPI00114CA49E|nr:hypothetical protein [Oligoflexus tunisiensis]
MENLFQSKNDLALLTRPHANPCLSLYVPLARGGNRKGDELKLEQLKRQAEIMLNDGGLHSSKASELVQPIENLLEDGIRQLKGEKIVGLAFFVAPDIQRTYLASHATPEKVTVDNHFDLRPLVDLLPLEDEFFVLAINKNQVILFQGAQGTLTPIFLPPGASPELYDRAATHALTPDPEIDESGSLAASNLVGKLYSTVSLDRDFKFVDEYIRNVCHDIDQYLNGKKAPLIIASTEALKPIVEKHLKYRHVASEEIRTPTSPDRSNAAELHQQAQRILERFHNEEKRKQLARYREVAGTRFSATLVADVLQAARTGQIEVLLASARRNLYGRYDRDTGEVEIHSERKVTDTELVSLAVQEAINHDARVYLVDDADLPPESPLAAILRW